ncbi:type II secretion system protein [Halobacillus naozhouensis]|uniref:Type II secretion system protein n=1 Tax=Halobacillus naozhouensis TaxID=554880 RepID=A0ABY8ITB2_9BACI|nr:type II secretion system protein [Halobacillus naozhouensis]WFT73248.1 type II secretion system protein [Halobacillus naozhouensis]
MNNKGFTVVEVICAFGVLLIIATSILPLLGELRLSQKELAEERAIISKLQNELLKYKLHPREEYPFTKEYDLMTVTYKKQPSLLEACATWETRRDHKELCLYASRQ